MHLIINILLCCPVLYPQIVGGDWFPGAVTVKLSKKQSPMRSPEIEGKVKFAQNFDQKQVNKRVGLRSCFFVFNSYLQGHQLQQ